MGERRWARARAGQAAAAGRSRGWTHSRCPAQLCPGLAGAHPPASCPLSSHTTSSHPASHLASFSAVRAVCQRTALTDMVMAAAAAAAAKMTGAVLPVPPWQCADGASHLLLPHDPARPPPPPPPVVVVAHRCTEPHRSLTPVLPALVAAAVPFHPRCVAVLVVLCSSTSSSPAPRPPPHPLLSSSAGYLLSPCLVPSPRTSPLPPPPLHLLPLFLPLRLPLPLQRLSDRRPDCPQASDLRARPPQRTAWQAAAPSGWLVHSGRPRCASVCSAATRRTRRATARMWRRSPRLCVCDHRQPPPPPPPTPTRRRRLPAPRRPPPPLLPPPLPPRPSPAAVVHRRGTTWRSAAMTTRRRRRRSR